MALVAFMSAFKVSYGFDVIAPFRSCSLRFYFMLFVLVLFLPPSCSLQSANIKSLVLQGDDTLTSELGANGKRGFESDLKIFEDLRNKTDISYLKIYR